MHSEILWFFSFLFLGCFLKTFLNQSLFLEKRGFPFRRTLSSHRYELEKVGELLREIEEILRVGLLPAPEKWKDIARLPAPWGRLAGESLMELRAAGGSLLPTLKRLRELAFEQSICLGEARAKSSQALAQVFICSLLVPCLGFSLYFLLPEISLKGRVWWLACIAASCWSGSGAIWLFSLSEASCWGGLKSTKRLWLLGSQCAGERFLALVRTGMPPDQAWIKMGEFLSSVSPDLCSAWGFSIWSDSALSFSGAAEKLILSAGGSMKKSIQVSLMEGRACLDGVDSVLIALRKDMRSQMDRELSLLATRALKPLFLCVAPALMGLLFFGIWLGSKSILGDGFYAF